MDFRSSGENLSRTSDHLGNISRLLRDLTGFATLAYELIQNADDARTATSLRFDIQPEGLHVWNNGSFTDCGDQTLVPDECLWLFDPTHRCDECLEVTDKKHRCDFHAFRLVSAGDKRHREGTTGAFGVGFTAVYQLTDKPQLISSGRHWMIDETAGDTDRIDVCKGCNTCTDHLGTRFVLPWALDGESAFRRRTKSPPFETARIDELRDTLLDAVPTAMLFLKRLTTIEVRSQGQHAEFSREVNEADVTLRGPSGPTTWRLFKGRFDAQADSLRERYGDKIEESRSPEVTIAVPLDGEARGRLCATLPTSETTGLPFHINADFFPSSDRQRLPREGYQGEWNAAAMAEAAETVADSLEDLRQPLGPKRLWGTLKHLFDAHGAVERDGINPWLGFFWESVTRTVSESAIVWTAGNSWVRTEEAMLRRGEADPAVLDLLTVLGLEVVSAELSSSIASLPTKSLGLRDLGLEDLVSSLEESEDSLSDLARDSLPLLLRELDRLLGLAAQPVRTALLPRIRTLILAPTVDDRLSAFDEAFRGDDDSVKLFSIITSDFSFLDIAKLPSESSRLIELCPDFSVESALDLCEGVAADHLTAILEEDATMAARILGWFAHREAVLLADEDLCERLLDLPIFPTEQGYRAMSELALPGDFKDELGLAELADVSKMGDYLPFLRKAGARTLTFSTYARNFLPAAADTASHEQWERVVTLVAEKLSSIEDDPQVTQVLRTLPLVITNGTPRFRRGQDVYFPSALMDALFGNTYARAEVPDAKHHAVKALYEWLGVAHEPRAKDVIAAVQGLLLDTPTAANRGRVAQLIKFLGFHFREDPERLRSYIPLKQLAWLPAEGHDEWLKPTEIYTVLSRHLFATQGPFLDIPRDVQSEASKLLEWLGIQSWPPASLVVDHVLACSASGAPVSPEVYRVLNTNAKDPSIARLADTSCLHLGEGRWINPKEVYWYDNPFGRFRALLSPKFREYADLLTALGVKTRPDHIDAVEVLTEISRDFGAYNNVLEDPADRQILLTCWKILQRALMDEEIDEHYVADACSGKTILDPRFILSRPSRLFFLDAPDMATHLSTQLHDHFIPREEDAWRAMLAAGVRNLSKAVELEIVEREAARSAAEVADVLSNRVDLLARVLEAKEGPAFVGWRSRLANLSFVHVERLRVRYSLPEFDVRGETFEAPAQFVEDEQVIYIQDHDRMWTAFARELLRALAPDWDSSPLVHVVKMILTSPTVEHAAFELDDAGIPRTSRLEDETIESTILEDLGGDPDGDSISSPPADNAWSSAGDMQAFTGEDFADYSGDEASPNGDLPLIGQANATDSEETERVRSAGSASAVDETDEPDSPASAGASSDRLANLEGAAPAESPQDERARTKARSLDESEPRPRRSVKHRLRSYVEAEDSEHSDISESVHEPSEADPAGIRRVMRYEELRGRHPKEKSHNHHGYDIESMDADGNIVRYIEVKSREEFWDAYGRALSATQFRMALELGDQYWLYVVERAPYDDFRVWAIQNPAQRVNEFYFDGGWKDVADIEDELLPAPPSVMSSKPDNLEALPFFDLTMDSPLDEAAGWVVAEPHQVQPGLFVVQIIGRALGEAMDRGSLAIVDPTRDAPSDGQSVLVDLGDRVDPETGSRLTTRVWWGEADESGALQRVVLGCRNPGGQPITIDDANSIQVLGVLIDTIVGDELINALAD